jgi:hypothetical protein
LSAPEVDARSAITGVAWVISSSVTVQNKRLNTRTRSRSGCCCN